MRTKVLLAAAVMLLAVGCSGSSDDNADQASGSEGQSAAAAEDSPARSCSKEVMAALGFKWREDVGLLRDDDGKAALQAFMDANMVDYTPQYKIFIDHWTAGSSPIALAVGTRTKSGEEAIIEQLAAEAPGVEADCATAAG
ncbi:hypothetical protein ACFV3E_06025 [Streptomyces sp. NPDC059718]